MLNAVYMMANAAKDAEAHIWDARLVTGVLSMGAEEIKDLDFGYQEFCITSGRDAALSHVQARLVRILISNSAFNNSIGLRFLVKARVARRNFILHTPYFVLLTASRSTGH